MESEAECATARDCLQQQYSKKMEAFAKQHVRATLMLATFLVIKLASSLSPSHAMPFRPPMSPS